MLAGEKAQAIAASHAAQASQLQPMLAQTRVGPDNNKAKRCFVCFICSSLLKIRLICSCIELEDICSCPPRLQQEGHGTGTVGAAGDSDAAEQLARERAARIRNKLGCDLSGGVGAERSAVSESAPVG